MKQVQGSRCPRRPQYYPKAQIGQGAEPNAMGRVGADGETGDFKGLTLSNSGPVFFRKPGLFPRQGADRVKRSDPQQGSQTGRRHNAYALDRLCAVFWLGPMDHWNCDRGCKPAQLVEQLGGNWFAYPSTEPRFGFWAGWPPHSTQLRRIIGVSWRPP